ncbi:MAG: type II toxin-antitoxin system mRNA interferase toxin, RelE/StbE family [Syntrophales bacterium]|nr:type II toxin-antitoxin system mRNA interferase toxin, RelE/StbE family [Syntrophales bacterium]
MIKVTWDQGFKKIYQKKVKNNDELKKKFWKAMELFSENPFNPHLRTHKLTGKLEGLWAFSVTYDCRVSFSFLSKSEVLLIDIGGHDEVY